jgi:PAS domain S-box-containing protein
MARQPAQVAHQAPRSWVIAATDRALNDPRRLGDVIDAIERLPLPVFAVDRYERIRWLNIAARSLVGENTGLPFARVVAPESLPSVRDEFVKKLLGTASSSEYSAHLLRPDGTRIQVEISSVPIVDDGRIVGVFGAARADDREIPATAKSFTELTPRQAQVLELLARGCSTAQVAERLGIANETVRNHVRGALRRLGAHSRLEAILAAKGDRLIS